MKKEEIKEKTVTITYKTTEAQRKAIENYEKTVERINCRLPKGTKERIQATGASVNAFIIEAVTEKLDAIEKGQGVFSAEKSE